MTLMLQNIMTTASQSKDNAEGEVKDEAKDEDVDEVECAWP